MGTECIRGVDFKGVQQLLVFLMTCKKFSVQINMFGKVMVKSKIHFKLKN